MLLLSCGYWCVKILVFFFFNSYLSKSITRKPGGGSLKKSLEVENFENKVSLIWISNPLLPLFACKLFPLFKWENKNNKKSDNVLIFPNWIWKKPDFNWGNGITTILDIQAKNSLPAV